MKLKHFTKEELTDAQLATLVNLVNHSIEDINSYDELTEQEKSKVERSTFDSLIDTD